MQRPRGVPHCGVGFGEARGHLGDGSARRRRLAQLRNREPLVEQGRFIAPGIGRGELEQQFEIALDIFRLQLRQRRAVVQ